MGISSTSAARARRARRACGSSGRRPADDHAVYAAAEEAFADHWEHDPRLYEEWQRRCRDSDRSLWLVARDGDEVAGVAVNDWNRFGGGWVGASGTRRPWRGRGVGRALLLASFGEFHRRGERLVQLAVDGESPTGAVRLYERVGMHVVWRADVYEKELVTLGAHCAPGDADDAPAVAG